MATVEALAAYGTAYGRHCALAAQAQHEGEWPGAIAMAARGKGDTPNLQALRNQYARIVEAAHLARLAGHIPADVIDVAVATKAVVEGEWVTELTMPTGLT